MNAVKPLATSPLARQQAVLVAALFERLSENAIKTLADYAHLTRPGEKNDGVSPPAAAPAQQARRGFAVYQANGHELAVRALEAAFPVLAQMLGDDNFGALARAFWHAGPPGRGDIAQWGGGLPAFIAASAQLQQEPCLPDVARVEWGLHEAAGAADETADLVSFGLLAGVDPGLVKLRLSASACVFESQLPVVSLIQAHQVPAEPGRPLAGSEAPHAGSQDVVANGGDPHEAALADAARLLHQRVPQNAVVWRQGLRPSLREAISGEVTFLARLQTGASLSEALDAAGALDFQAWLLMAVQTGLLLGAQV